MIYEKRVLPLAGLVQAIHLVCGAAKTGMVAQDSLEKTLKCIFVQNPGSIAEVYSGTSDIPLGLNLLREILNRFDPEAHADVVRYSLAVMGLERNLARHPDVLRELGARIASLDEQQMLSSGQSAISDETVASLAGLYEETIGQVEPRLRISGNRNHLQNLANVHRIRALLLAAVRSAVLWHQTGGRRWQLLLARGKLKRALDAYI